MLLISQNKTPPKQITPTDKSKFPEMDTRGLTSLEEGGAKKSQWSLWEQADKISGGRANNKCYHCIENEDEIMQSCEKNISVPTPLEPRGSVVPSIYPPEGPLSKHH